MEKPVKPAANERSKYQILVIDDDESMRFMLQTKLFQAGYSVTVAASGTHAMQIFQTQKKFDLVICDMKMPLKSGIDVVKFMREQDIQSPFILLTGYPEKNKIISAAQLGVMDILVKPVRHNDLMRVISLKLGETEGGDSQAS